MVKITAKPLIAPSPLRIERAVLDLTFSALFEGGTVYKVHFFSERWSILILTAHYQTVRENWPSKFTDLLVRTKLSRTSESRQFSDGHLAHIYTPEQNVSIGAAKHLVSE